jgi:hypothetical protein
MGEGGGEEEEACVVVCTMYIPAYGLYALPLMLRGCTALKAARAFLVDESGFTA